MRISDWSSDVCSSDLRHRTEIIACSNSGALSALRSSGSNRITIKTNCTTGVIVRGNREGDTAWLYVRIANGHNRNAPRIGRSEEHTSEIQSLMRISYAFFCFTKKLSYHTLSHLLTNTPN